MVEKSSDEFKVTVRVGKATQPTEEHYIDWIEVITSEKAHRHVVNPGEPPEATVVFEVETDPVTDVCFCIVKGIRN